MVAFVTLSRAPAWPLSPDGAPVEGSVISGSSQGGYEVTRPRYTRQRREWGVSFRNLSLADIEDFRDFWSGDIANGSGAFDWTHPVTDEVVSVRLVNGQYEAAQVSPTLFDLSFKLREV